MTRADTARRRLLRGVAVLTATGATLAVLPATATAAAHASRSSASSDATSTRVTVRRGDTVSEIAHRLGSSVAAVIAANHLDRSAFITVGQKLAVPRAGSRPAKARPAKARPAKARPAADRRSRHPGHRIGGVRENRATISRVPEPTTARMKAIVAEAARKQGVEPSLALAVAFQESSLRHAQVSGANAIGAMQVTPAAGEWAGSLVGRRLDLFDPQDNAAAGTVVLRALLDRVDERTALAAYYQGLTSVRKRGPYAETRRYVASVLTHQKRF